MEKRSNPLTHMNHWQEKILLPFFVLFLITLLCVVVLVMIQNPVFAGVSFWSIPFQGAAGGLALIKLCFAGIIAVAFLGLFYWGVQVTNRILGAYERLLRELDGVIANRSQGPLRVRSEDEMFAGLLKRVNILIERRRQEQDHLTSTWYEDEMRPQGLSPRDIFWGN